MFNFFKKSEKQFIQPIIEKESKVHFTITFTDGKILQWEFPLIKNEKLINIHMKKFYKWFFSRTNSNYFIFKDNKGETMIKRDTIYTFSLRIV